MYKNICTILFCCMLPLSASLEQKISILTSSLKTLKMLLVSKTFETEKAILLEPQFIFKNIIQPQDLVTSDPENNIYQLKVFNQFNSLKGYTNTCVPYSLRNSIWSAYMLTQPQKYINKYILILQSSGDNFFENLKETSKIDVCTSRGIRPNDMQNIINKLQPSSYTPPRTILEYTKKIDDSFRYI